MREKRPPSPPSTSKPGAAAVTPLILRLMFAAIFALTLSLCSLAIDRVTDNKKTAVLREHPQVITVAGSSLLSTAKDVQSGWSIRPTTR
jgi:cytochrome c biogenesis protein CcdA